MPAFNGHTISLFNGGQSDEEVRGVPGSFKRGWNLNIHKKERNTLSANQKLIKISGTTVTDLIIKFVPVSSTKSYGFGNSGCIYKIENNTVTKVFTDTNGAILDAEIFYGYLYWTTATKLGRCIETSANWAADASKDYKTLTSCSYHPVFVVPKSDLMCIGNDRYVATLSGAGVWNNEALDLFYGWVVKCLNLIKPNLLIGAKDSKKAELSEWDLISESYDPIENWEERDISAFFKAIGGTFIFTPELLYRYTQGLIDQAKELPSEVLLGAIDLWKGKFLFGCTNGVYSYHRKNKNYPIALNLEYTPSPITIANFDTKTVEIGAVLGRDESLLVGWKDGATYGIDNIDPSNKANAVYESLVFDAGKPFSDKLSRVIKITTKPLPEDCSVKLYYKVNGGDWTLATRPDGEESFDTLNGTKSIHAIEGQGENYEVRAEIYSHGNDTPEITSITTYFKELGLY